MGNHSQKGRGYPWGPNAHWGVSLGGQPIPCTHPYSRWQCSRYRSWYAVMMCKGSCQLVAYASSWWHMPVETEGIGDKICLVDCDC